MKKDCATLQGNLRQSVTKLWTGLRGLYSGIAIRDANTLLLQGSGGKGQFFTTRSAIGVLKLAEQNERVDFKKLEEDDFAFMTPEEASLIKEQNRAAACFRQEAFFYFTDKSSEEETVAKSWESYFKDALDGSSKDDLSRKVRARDNRRAFVLVETSPSPPANAYVAVNRKGLWYSISEDDIVSKANFALLNQIVTIQSVPQMNQQLQASIPVGR